MKPSLIVAGLGNPGSSYAATRHNAGFCAIDALSAAFSTGAWKQSGKFRAQMQEARICAAPILIVKPQTFMNLSGDAVGKILDFYRMPAADHLLVLCDDVDLPLGTLRLRKTGSAGTHNGLQSIVDRIGEGFARLRIGIGPSPKGADLATWVLSALSPEEAKVLERTYANIPEVVQKFVLGAP